MQQVISFKQRTLHFEPFREQGVPVFKFVHCCERTQGSSQQICLTEYEVCLQSLRETLSVNLSQTMLQIPADLHMYWYTAEFGVSCMTVALQVMDCNVCRICLRGLICPGTSCLPSLPSLMHVIFLV